MKVSNAILAAATFASAGASLAEQPEHLERRRPQPPTAPRNWPLASAPRWHEACVDYEATLKRIVGECDRGREYIYSENGQAIKAECPEGTVEILSSQPVAYCIQPVIL